MYLQTLPDIDMDHLSQAYESAVAQLRASRLSDAELIFTPSQIALACFAAAAPTFAAAWAESKEQSSLLTFIVPGVQSMIERDGVEPALEAVKEIDKRLRICKNPEKVKGSKAWLKRQREAEEAAREKRMRKAEEVKRAMEEDPFGGKLEDGIPVDKPLDDDDDD